MVWDVKCQTFCEKPVTRGSSQFVGRKLLYLGWKSGITPDFCASFPQAETEVLLFRQLSGSWIWKNWSFCVSHRYFCSRRRQISASLGRERPDDPQGPFLISDVNAKERDSTQDGQLTRLINGRDTVGGNSNKDVRKTFVITAFRTQIQFQRFGVCFCWVNCCLTSVEWRGQRIS